MLTYLRSTLLVFAIAGVGMVHASPAEAISVAAVGGDPSNCANCEERENRVFVGYIDGVRTYVVWDEHRLTGDCDGGGLTSSEVPAWGSNGAVRFAAVLPGECVACGFTSLCEHGWDDGPCHEACPGGGGFFTSIDGVGSAAAAGDFVRVASLVKASGDITFDDASGVVWGAHPCTGETVEAVRLPASGAETLARALAD